MVNNFVFELCVIKKGLGCNVALIKCTWIRESPRGLGFRKGGYKGPDGKQGELVYKQPGTEVDIPVTARRVPSK